MFNRTIIIKIFLFVFIILNLKFSVYSAELHDYGFENFEALSFYLSNLDHMRVSSIPNDGFIIQVESPNGYDDEFKNFLSKVLVDAFDVLNYKLLKSSNWRESQVPESIARQKKIFNFFLKEFEEIDSINIFKYFNVSDNCYFATKDNIDEPCQVVIIGDMHSNYRDFSSIIKKLISKEILTSNLKLAADNRIIFLGDFVDRGSQGLELALFLFLLKILNPETVTILKGNHEDFNMTYEYGFKNELLHKLNNNSAISFYGQFLSLFYFLPEAYCLQVRGKNFLFSHAGWSENFDYLDFINDGNSVFIKTFCASMGSPFLWNDMSPFCYEIEPVYGRGFCYPVDRICDLMNLKGIDAIFKGHDHFMPKKIEFEEEQLSVEQLRAFSKGFCELVEDKIFLIISTSIVYAGHTPVNYKPSYGLLNVDGSDYFCKGIVCS